MRTCKALAFLLLASPLAAQAQIRATVKASATPSVIISPAAGDYVLAICDSPDATVSDSGGNVYTSQGAVNSGGAFETAWIAGPVAAKQISVKCTSAQWLNEIYTITVNGALSYDAAVTSSGPGAPTSSSVTTTASGDLVIGYCQSGSCGKPVGWTSLSTFDGNVVASLMPAAPGVVRPAFVPSGNYTETLMVFHLAGNAPPTALVIPFAGCCTLTFPIVDAAHVPSCTPADGQCSIVVTVCDAATPPNCSSGTSGKVTLTKTVTLPLPQTQTYIIVTATSP